MKIKDAKVYGTPFVTVMGDKFDGENFEIESIKTGEKELMNLENLIQKLKKLISKECIKNYWEHAVLTMKI